MSFCCYDYYFMRVTTSRIGGVIIIELFHIASVIVTIPTATITRRSHQHVWFIRAETANQDIVSNARIDSLATRTDPWTCDAWVRGSDNRAAVKPGFRWRAECSYCSYCLRI